MSIAAMKWVWNLPVDVINSPQCLLLLALADHADDDGFCWPSQDKLMRKTRQSERTIRDVTQHLIRMGALHVRKRHRLSTEYFLHLDWHGDSLLPAESAGQKTPQPRAAQRAARSAQCPDPAQVEHSLPADPAGQDGPANPAILTGNSLHSDRQILPFRPAGSAGKPSKNLQRTLRGERARICATPLPRSWQPSEEDAAYARQIGLNPAVVAQRFRKQFLATGRACTDWAARWELWCDEDAVKAPPTANAPTTLLPQRLATTSTTIPADPDGLDAAGRSWVVSWEKKQAAGEELDRFEATMRSYAASAFAVVQQRKLASVVQPGPRLVFSTQR